MVAIEGRQKSYTPSTPPFSFPLCSTFLSFSSFPFPFSTPQAPFFYSPKFRTPSRMTNCPRFALNWVFWDTGLSAPKLRESHASWDELVTLILLSPKCFSALPGGLKEAARQSVICAWPGSPGPVMLRGTCEERGKCPFCSQMCIKRQNSLFCYSSADERNSEVVILG